MREGGLFITFEGIEGCGKSTQSKLLVDHLVQQGQTVIFTREPGGTPTAEKIREILLDIDNQTLYPLSELLLYSTSRAQHVEELILPTLRNGDTVICIRFADSTKAYQEVGMRLPEEIVSQLISISTKGLRPDITFLLDVDIDFSLKHSSSTIGLGKNQERIKFRKRVREGYLRLSQKEPQRIIVVNGRKTIREIHEEILHYLFQWYELK